MKLVLLVCLAVVGTLAYVPKAKKIDYSEAGDINDLVEEKFGHLGVNWLGCLTKLLGDVIGCGKDIACYFKALQNLVACLLEKKLGGPVTPVHLVEHDHLATDEDCFIPDGFYGDEITEALADLVEEEFGHLGPDWTGCFTKFLADVVSCDKDVKCYFTALDKLVTCVTKKNLVDPK
ncbi:hypothetical protein O0L34_g3498 [Tuta absoluta]|nr:hypothetical protein O0L34_g3498 [Tuta absoluta]